MDILYVDIETYSSVNLKKSGVYAYAQSPDFEVLLIGYALNDEPVRIVEYAIPQEREMFQMGQVKRLLCCPDVLKIAYNAPFEWWCLNRAGIETPIEQWQCAMVHALYCGLPGGLDRTGNALGLTDDKKKLQTGKSLIRTFCAPVKPTKANGWVTRYGWDHDEAKWTEFAEYCRRDVEAEREIERRLRAFPVPESEWRLWRRDCETNARGIPVDWQLVERAVVMGKLERERLIAEAQDISGLENANSRAQLLTWLTDALPDEDVGDVTRATVKRLLGADLSNEDARRLLEIRQLSARTSVAKYAAMQAARGDGGRIRGVTQFYGAHTGRYTGRLVQLQNLPRNTLDLLDEAREAVKQGDAERAAACHPTGDINDVLSQLIRTALIAPDGQRLVVADFASIEARVVAWLAGDERELDLFRANVGIYEATAAAIYKVPVETVYKDGANHHLRAAGKVAALACGFGGGIGALEKMGAAQAGLSAAEMDDVVNKWRETHPKIVSFWYDVWRNALRTVSNSTPCGIPGKLRFAIAADKERGVRFLTVELPSRRKLYYAEPRIEQSESGRDMLSVMTQTGYAWRRKRLWHGLLVENIVQAVARDCLTRTLVQAESQGLPVLFHVHDEVICAGDDADLARLLAIMNAPIPWAPGLPLRAEGFVSNYYKKD